MKKILNLLLISILVCTTVYAKTYKISPTTKPAASGNYNVYTPNNYTPAQVQQGTGVGGIVEFVMDYSGSMSSVIDETKYLVRSLYPAIPAGTKVGLRVFGQSGGYNPYTYTPETYQNIAKTGSKYKINVILQGQDCVGSTTESCSNTVQVLPVGQYDGNTFYQGMEKYPTGGATPLVFGLYLAVNKDLANFPAASAKKIILITDGGENCGGDPCEFAKKLVQERSDIIIDVILTSGTLRDFACLANETGGKIYNLNSNDITNGIFSSILLQSIQSAPQVPNTETPSVQTPSNNNSTGSSYEYVPD